MSDSWCNDMVRRYHFSDEWDELGLVLGSPLESLGRGGGGEEQEASRRIIHYWANFVKHHDPNVGGQASEEAVWPRFSGPSWQHLSLGRRPAMEGGLRARVCQVHIQPPIVIHMGWDLGSGSCAI